MKVVSSIKSAKMRHPACQVVRRKGKIYVINKVEPQLRQIGEKRAGQIYRWLLEADLALKGTSSQDERARVMLEQLIVRLSKQLATKPAAAHA